MAKRSVSLAKRRRAAANEYLLKQQRRRRRPSSENDKDNLVPDIDFTQWYIPPQGPMGSTTKNSFTNVGTGWIQLDIGAELGKTYSIMIDQTRGPGALRIYLAASQGIEYADDVAELSGGRESFTLAADGPWLTFRASVGATTTVVTALTVTEVSE